MDGRREEDLTAIAWPGFVDILSAVIIMFVFFVMVTAVALYVHTITYKSKLEQLMKTDYSTKTKVLEQKITEVQKQKKVLEHLLAEYEQELYQTRAEFSESQEQKTIINENNNSLIVFFGTDSISVTKDSEEKITAFLNKKLNSGKKYKVKIIAGKNPKAPIKSIARKLAVARIFNLRNVMLSLKIEPNDISATINNKEQVENSYHWTKIELKEEK